MSSRLYVRDPVPNINIASSPSMQAHRLNAPAPHNNHRFPNSKIDQPIILLAAFRAHRRPNPSIKPRQPSTVRMCRAAVNKLSFASGPTVPWNNRVGVVCMRVLRMSNGCVMSVARVPAHSPLVLTTSQVPVSE